MTEPILEQVYNRIWTLGVRLRNRARRASLLGSIEPSLVKLARRLVPPPKDETIVDLARGMHMKVPPGCPAARSYSSGSYEPDVTHVFMSLVQPGMTVVDAGANVGYYTLLAAGVLGTTGRIFAFEPDPLNYSYLAQNVETNNCSGVTTVRKALSSTTSTSRFVLDSYGAEGFLTQDLDRSDAIDVATVTLDDFLEADGWTTVHVLKLDIEGSEKKALEGMQEVSRRNPALQLIMELNSPAISRSGDTVEAITGVLRDLGFLGGYVINGGLRAFSMDAGLPRSQATYDLFLVKRALHV